jgi:hypothetical protein
MFEFIAITSAFFTLLLAIVTARTVSDIIHALLTLLIANGFWTYTNQNTPIWRLFLQAMRISKRKLGILTKLDVKHRTQDADCVRDWGLI